MYNIYVCLYMYEYIQYIYTHIQTYIKSPHYILKISVIFICQLDSIYFGGKGNFMESFTWHCFVVSSDTTLLLKGTRKHILVTICNPWTLHSVSIRNVLHTAFLVSCWLQFPDVDLSIPRPEVNLDLHQRVVWPVAFQTFFKLTFDGFLVELSGS